MKDRMSEFVQYHLFGDGECNNVVLKRWADERSLSLQDKYMLSFLFAITYCVESAIILYENGRKDGLLDNLSLKKLKQKIVFQSDRKYMRMKDNFERCVADFQNHCSATEFLKRIGNEWVIDLDTAINEVSRWVMFGRFSAYLFLETFVSLTGIEVVNVSIDWKRGDTATSGLLNLFGFDDYADFFDRNNRLMVEISSMDKMLKQTIDSVRSAGGNTNVTMIETSLCAYRKFFKGSRYNGYYLDRMLEEVYRMRSDFPGVSNDILRIRRVSFDKKYLGEIGGWNGIRKDLKKLYKTTGLLL